MKLTRVRIKNLRCIEDAEVKIRDFTSLIGPNNCGKSSFIRGIQVLLNQISPEPEEWRSGHADEEMIIEGDFEELEEWEISTPGVAGIVHNNMIRLRVVATLDDGGEKVQTKYEAFTPQMEIEGWSDSWGELSDKLRSIAADIQLTGTNFRSAAGKDRLRAAIKENASELITAGEPIWTSESISFKQALQQAIPQAHIVPAVRDATSDGKPGAKTSFGLLLEKIILPAIQSSEEYQELLGVVEKVRGRLSSDSESQLQAVQEVSQAISDRLSSVISAKVRVTMDAPDAGKFVGANTGLRLNDGTDTSIALQGHGLQRSLIFALIEVLATQESLREKEGEARQQVRCTVLLFEEPELYFHPHIMRRLKRALQTVSGQKYWQVILSTHSPFLIDVGEDPQSLVIFKRANRAVPPTVKQLSESPFGEDSASKMDREALRAVLNFHPTVCEVFFASRTVLVEGPSELAVLVHHPQFFELAGIDENKRADCTVVSCAGKWTIPPIANLLNQFEIPFRVIHDNDAKGRSADELNAVAPIDPYRANARIREFAPSEHILVVDDTLEDLLWESKPSSSGDKPHRAWKRVAEICEGRQDLDHVPKLKEFVRFAFDW